MSETYTFDYPFVLADYTHYDEDGPVETKSWRPGVSNQFVHPDDFEPVAHGIGKQIVTVVSRHKPGRYPERIFYTRQWEDPKGRVFGKKRLLVKTTPAFKRLISGYQYGYRLVAP